MKLTAIRSMELGVCLALASCVGDRPQGSADEARSLARQTLAIEAPEVADPTRWTIESCVVSALEHSPRVREALARVGVAEADWSMTVLPREPELAASALFPVGGGDPELEASLALDLLDLLRIPARRDVADAALRAAIFDVARECVALARDVQDAYVRALAADETEIAHERIARLAREFADGIAAQVEAGAARTSQSDSAQLSAIEAELAHDAARVEARVARRALAQRIGIEGDGLDLVLQPFEPTAPIEASPELIDAALERRLDVRALAQRVEESRAAVELAGGVLPGLEVGAGVLRPERPAGAEREPTRVGPSVSVPLPWFGRSAARIAAAEAQLALRVAQLEAARAEAKRELQDQCDRQSQAFAEWRRREQELEPKARELAERAQLAAKAGQLPWTEAHAAREVAQQALLTLVESRRRARAADLAIRGMKPLPRSAEHEPTPTPEREPPKP